jgi:predicted lactoylglutathione lyase
MWGSGAAGPTRTKGGEFMARQIFVNLPVKDLENSMRFFTGLDFSFDSQFTDENAACMVVTDDIYVMLLTEPFFKTFTRKDLVDARKGTEVLVALAVDSRHQVDALVDKALETGGQSARDPDDQGFMYTRSFEDLDGHIWEIFWMDESAIH